MGNNNKNSDSAFIRQGSILAIASLVSRIIGLIYRVPLKAIIGKVGNDYYGTAYEIYNILLLISAYSIPLAVSKLVSYRMAKGRVKDAYTVLKCSLLFAGISGSAACAIILVFCDTFTNLLKTPLASIALQVLAPTILIVAILGVFRGFFQGLHTTVPSALSQVLEQIVNAIVSIVAAYQLYRYGKVVGAILNDEDNYAAAYGAAGGTLGTASGAFVGLIFIVFIFSLYKKQFDKKALRDIHPVNESFFGIMKILIFTMIPVLLSTTVYNISSILDQGIFKNIVVLQGYTANEISEWWGVFVGQFKVLINVPISIASAIAATSVPALTAAYHNRDIELVRKQISMAYRFIMIIAFPCAVGFAILGSPIMQLLFADSDKTSGLMLSLGSIAVIFYSLSSLSNGLLQGIDRLSVPVRNAIVALVVHLLLLVILLEFFQLNIFAVIIAYIFYAFCMCLFNNMSLHKYSGFKMNVRKTIIIPGISSAVMGVAVFFVYNVLEMALGNAIATFISIFAGILVYIIVLLIFKGVTKEELAGFPGGRILAKIGGALHLI